MASAHPLGTAYSVVGTCVAVNAGNIALEYLTATIISNTQFIVYIYNANGVLATSQLTVFYCSMN